MTAPEPNPGGVRTAPPTESGGVRTAPTVESGGVRTALEADPDGVRTVLVAELREAVAARLLAERGDPGVVGAAARFAVLAESAGLPGVAAALEGLRPSDRGLGGMVPVVERGRVLVADCGGQVSYLVAEGLLDLVSGTGEPAALWALDIRFPELLGALAGPARERGVRLTVLPQQAPGPSLTLGDGTAYTLPDGLRTGTPSHRPACILLSDPLPEPPTASDEPGEPGGPGEKELCLPAALWQRLHES